MEYPIYNDILNSRDWMAFKFESVGPKGKIPKVVQFTPMGRRGFYNLSLGDWHGGDAMDFASTTDNGDRDKVLATVAMLVRAWTERYPRRKVIFQGSNLARTRLYRMVINKAWDELDRVFLIQGLDYRKDGKLIVTAFDPNKNFQAYVIQRRKLNEYPKPPP